MHKLELQRKQKYKTIIVKSEIVFSELLNEIFKILTNYLQNKIKLLIRYKYLIINKYKLVFTIECKIKFHCRGDGNLIKKINFLGKWQLYYFETSFCFLNRMIRKMWMAIVLEKMHFILKIK